MRKLSQPIKRFADSAVDKARLQAGMMDVIAAIVLAMSMADILLHRKRRGMHVM